MNKCKTHAQVQIKAKRAQNKCEQPKWAQKKHDQCDRVVQMNSGKDGEGSRLMCDPSGGGGDDDHGDGS